MTEGTPEKIDILTKHAAHLEKGLRGYFKTMSDHLEGQGLTASMVDNIILNTLARYMAQTLTYITVLLKASESGKDPTSEEMSETMEKISSEVFESVQTILSKHTGKSILHVSKRLEEEKP